MWNCMSRGELKLKVDRTMVKLGRAAGLTGAMHKGGKKKERGKKKKKKEGVGVFFSKFISWI